MNDEKFEIIKAADESPIAEHFRAIAEANGPREGEVGTDGRPTEAFWSRKLDDLEEPFRRRPLNDIVRMKFRAELRRLEDEAERMDETTAFRIALAKRLNGHK